MNKTGKCSTCNTTEEYEITEYDIKHQNILGQVSKKCLKCNEQSVYIYV